MLGFFLFIYKYTVQDFIICLHRVIKTTLYSELLLQSPLKKILAYTTVI